MTPNKWPWDWKDFYDSKIGREIKMKDIMKDITKRAIENIFSKNHFPLIGHGDNIIISKPERYSGIKNEQN